MRNEVERVLHLDVRRMPPRGVPLPDVMRLWREHVAVQVEAYRPGIEHADVAWELATTLSVFAKGIELNETLSDHAWMATIVCFMAIFTISFLPFCLLIDTSHAD